MIAKGANMHLKHIIPYAIFGLASVLPGRVRAQSNTTNIPNKQIAMARPIATLSGAYRATYNATTNDMLRDKSTTLIDSFIVDMLESQRKLAPYAKHMKTRTYKNMVRAELPGAPVGAHCMFGQYTHMQNALKSLGDTLTMIPSRARKVCTEFKSQMRNAYGNIPNAIYEGVAYKTNDEYTAALVKYMTKRGATLKSPESVLEKIEHDFEQNHFSIDRLAPGSILIVPRFHGATNSFHAIMYCGRGNVENGKFIADKNGDPVYAGHNRESLYYIFDAFDMSNVFAANMHVIAQEVYRREFAKIEGMTKAEMIAFIEKNSTLTPEFLKDMSNKLLLKVARAIYFQSPEHKKPATDTGNIQNIAQNMVPNIMALEMRNIRTI